MTTRAKKRKQRDRHLALERGMKTTQEATR